MGVMRSAKKAAQMAGHLVPPSVKKAVGDEVGRAVREVAPTPAEIASGLDKARASLAQHNPAAAEKVSKVANAALDKARTYLPGMVDRASAIVDRARAEAGGGTSGAGDGRAATHQEEKL